MRQTFDPPGELPALKWILLAVGATFVLQNILGDWFAHLLVLSGSQLRAGYFWTPLSYSLLHGGLLHVLFNLLMLWIFGQEVQRHLGGRKFLALYLASVVAGGVFWLLFNFNYGIALGASAGVSGVFAVFCLLHWHKKLTFFLYLVLPVRMTGKGLLLLFGGLDLAGFLLVELWETNLLRSGVAHSAHLGGILCGWVFYHYFFKGGFVMSNARPKVTMPAWLRKKPKGKGFTPKYKVNITNQNTLREEVDRILDKITSQGFGALSEEEKQTLDRAKDVLKR